jgi:hypothetical protein
VVSKASMGMPGTWTVSDPARAEAP